MGLGLDLRTLAAASLDLPYTVKHLLPHITPCLELGERLTSKLFTHLNASNSCVRMCAGMFSRFAFAYKVSIQNSFGRYRTKYMTRSPPRFPTPRRAQRTFRQPLVPGTSSPASGFCIRNCW